MSIVLDPVIDMDVWRTLPREQRDELWPLVHRLLELPRGATRIEYLPPTRSGPDAHDLPAALRITYTIKNERGVSLLDPSCTCGDWGHAIHFWQLTVDRPLTEQLPDWWRPATGAIG